MGYIRHHAIIVTSQFGDKMDEVCAEAKKVFAGFHSSEPSLVRSTTNGYVSLFIAPDGSKEGRTQSEHGDAERRHFLDWLDARDDREYFDWFEVCYGGDDHSAQIERIPQYWMDDQ